MNTHKPLIIVFFGPDGAGKTEHARRIAQYLRAHGYKVRQAWIRGQHSLAFLLALIFIRLGYYETVRFSDGTSEKVFDIRFLPALKPIWGMIESCSIMPWILWRVYLPRLFGYTVVLDRFVIDSVVYLSYRLGTGFLSSFLALVLLRFIPQDALLFHFDAEENVLKRRIVKDIVTVDFLLFQKKMYQVFAQNMGAKTIDTSKNSILDTFQGIIGELSKRQAES